MFQYTTATKHPSLETVRLIRTFQLDASRSHDPKKKMGNTWAQNDHLGWQSPSSTHEQIIRFQPVMLATGEPTLTYDIVAMPRHLSLHDILILQISLWVVRLAAWISHVVPVSKTPCDRCAAAWVMISV